MSILTCLDGIFGLSGFNTFCSACNVARSCVQCSCFSVDCIHKICHRDKQTGETIMVQIFAKPNIEQLPI